MAGRHMKPAIMELGGHAPVIVCDDVDPEATAAKSVKSKLRNAGQVCVSPTRFFVQDAIYKKFAAAFAEKASRVNVGDGRAPSTARCTVHNHRHHLSMSAYASDTPTTAGQEH